MLSRNISIVLCFLSLWASFGAAKHIENVFKSFDSIKLQDGKGYPYDLFRIDIGWKLSSGMAAYTGDTFKLNMPWVFDIRYVNSTGDSTFYQAFDLKNSDGTVVSSCDFTHAGGRSNASSVNCRVTRDISSYGDISGKLTFDISFDAGGRIETIPAAEHWIAGTNNVTFNGNLTQQVTFATLDVNSRGMVNQYDMKYQLFMYYMIPPNICNGKGILGGSFYFYTYRGTLQTSSSFVLWDMKDPDLYVATELSPYGMPLNYTDLNVLNYQTWNSGKKFKVQFGAIPAGSHLFYSFYSDPYLYNATDSGYMHYNPDVTVMCQDYQTALDFHYYRYRPAAPTYTATEQYYAPTTVTTTNTWCHTSGSTSFQTGIGKTVTEIVNVPPKTTAYTTISTDGTVGTTYTQNYTSDQSTLTVVEQTTIPTTSYTTLTFPWDNSVSTTYTLPYQSGDLNLIIVENTPKSDYWATTYTTITKPWNGGHTKTYTHSYTSGEQDIVVIVETPVSDYNATTYTTVTKPWYDDYTRTYTNPYGTNETQVIVVVETPAYYNRTHCTTVTLPWDQESTTSFIYPYSSGATAIIEIVQTPHGSGGIPAETGTTTSPTSILAEIDADEVSKEGSSTNRAYPTVSSSNSSHASWS